MTGLVDRLIRLTIMSKLRKGVRKEKGEEERRSERRIGRRIGRIYRSRSRSDTCTKN